MKTRRALSWPLALTIVIALHTTARAAPVEQRFQLKRGWNAIFLEVQPDPYNYPVTPLGCLASGSGGGLPKPCEIFGGIDGIKSVWAWNPQTSTVQYIQNPSEMVPTPPYMLSWFMIPPIPGEPDPTRNLHGITGETAYLVHRDENSTTELVELRVKGEPTLPRIRWVPDSYNLVGFHLDKGREPTFDMFFRSSPAHQSRPIYVLDNNRWKEINEQPPTYFMKDGEAYWVYCKGASTYTGPLAIQLELSSGLDFGSTLSETTVVLKNESMYGLGAEIQASSADAGIHYWQFSETNPAGVWKSLFGSTLPVGINAGSSQRLRLGPVRAGLDPNPNVPHRSNVEIKSSFGTRIVVPASEEGVDTAGLWVGSVTVDKVRKTGDAADTPVGSPFSFRVIMLVDPYGQVNLLSDVVQLWKDGTLKPDPENLGHMIVDSPGRFVLVADQSLLNDPPGAPLRGTALRDGQEVGRRISAATFGFAAPVPAAVGASFSLEGSARFVVQIGPDDLTNPFLHKFHKKHSAEESYRITRDMTFSFGRQLSTGGSMEPGLSFLNWGSTEVGGTYVEELRLLNMDKSVPNPQNTEFKVATSGTFRLRKVSNVSQLETTSVP